ncbi:MAG: hypothetical protein EAX90_03600 [Candidatus Heimdallarchaeota archaeon]|nr:hypothetical protein [Candidatus Heimdallarchaeota archaeon]
MIVLKRNFKMALLFSMLFFIINFPAIINTNGYETQEIEILTTINNLPDDQNLKINEGAYSADIHWVKTNITIDEKGSGKVSMIVNCTPDADHIGIYLRTLEELSSVLPEESYALTEGETLAINFTTSSVRSSGIAYLIYLQNTSKIQVNKNLVYFINYTADFFSTDLISHYGIDTNLVSINLNRPYWDDALEFEQMNIKLPIQLSNSSVTQTFLDNILFEVGAQMIGNYNLSYSGSKDSSGIYWFVFEVEKENVPDRGAFEATFYLSVDYFSLPRVINWFVLTFILVFSLVFLSLFIVVITLKNKSNNEVEEFKKELYDVLTQENE